MINSCIWLPMPPACCLPPGREWCRGAAKLPPGSPRGKSAPRRRGGRQFLGVVFQEVFGEIRDDLDQLAAVREHGALLGRIDERGRANGAAGHFHPGAMLAHPLTGHPVARALLGRHQLKGCQDVGHVSAPAS